MYSKILENIKFLYFLLDTFPYFMIENVTIHHLWKVPSYVRRKISYVCEKW